MKYELGLGYSFDRQEGDQTDKCLTAAKTVGRLDYAGGFRCCWKSANTSLKSSVPGFAGRMFIQRSIDSCRHCSHRVDSRHLALR